jgi:cell division protein YceG involved in septum cleavage
MLTRTQTFKKSIHLSYCAQREKDVVEEFIESSLTAASLVVAQETKKTDERDSVAAGYFPPVHTIIHT